MAKHKRSVALFEVINKDKRFDRRGGAIPTPSWWYKGKLAAPPPPSPLPQQPQAMQPRQIVPSASLSEAMLGGAGEPPLTRTSAAIIVGAIVVVLAVGILWTRWSHRTAASPNAAAILHGPAHPDVMDIASPRPAPQLPPAVNDSAPVATHAASVQTPARVPNQGYVVIRVYLTQFSATQTRDLLNQHDIPCTIERSVPGVSTQGFAVIGLTPFSTIGTTQYTDYIQQIKTVMNSKSVHPYWIKWPAAGQTG
jgi:hypothetical protein